MLHPVDEGVHRFPLVLVDDEPLGLVRQEDVPVLVHRPHLRRGPQEIRGLLGEELVVDVQLHHVPLLETVADFAFFPVDLDPLEPQIFIKKALGQQAHRLGQILVQALARVVGVDYEPSDGGFLL